MLAAVVGLMHQGVVLDLEVVEQELKVILQQEVMVLQELVEAAVVD
jgi:hypothetical protein